MNSKNDVIWSESRHAAGDLLTQVEEKFSPGEMIWGGLTAKGLIPSDSPIFVSDLFKDYQPPLPKAVNGVMYADLVKKKAKPALKGFIQMEMPSGKTMALQYIEVKLHWML